MAHPPIVFALCSVGRCSRCSKCPPGGPRPRKGAADGCWEEEAAAAPPPCLLDPGRRWHHHHHHHRHPLLPRCRRMPPPARRGSRRWTGPATARGRTMPLRAVHPASSLRGVGRDDVLDFAAGQGSRQPGVPDTELGRPANTATKRSDVGLVLWLVLLWLVLGRLPCARLGACQRRGMLPRTARAKRAAAQRRPKEREFFPCTTPRRVRSPARFAVQPRCLYGTVQGSRARHRFVAALMMPPLPAGGPFAASK
jgi:hypothetical protein